MSSCPVNTNDKFKKIIKEDAMKNIATDMKRVIDQPYSSVPGGIFELGKRVMYGRRGCAPVFGGI